MLNTFTPDFYEAHDEEWMEEQITLGDLAMQDAIEANETHDKAMDDCIPNYDPDAGDDWGQEQDMLEQGKIDDLLQMYWDMMDF